SSRHTPCAVSHGTRSVPATFTQGVPTMFRCLSLAAVALGLAVPATVAADDDPATKQVELKKGDKIIFFGDSLTALAGKAEAKAKGVPLNGLRKAFVEYWKKNNPDNKGSGILTYDGNHFNDTGHQFVAEQMLKKFK